VSTPNPEHSPHSFRVHTLNAVSLQEQPICLRARYVAYDLVATQGGVTLMVELIVPTEVAGSHCRFPVTLTFAVSKTAHMVCLGHSAMVWGLRKVSLTYVDCMAG